MLALGAGGDLGPAVDEVVGPGQPGRLVPHVVERPDRRGVVGDEHEVAAELLLRIGRDPALALGVEVAVGARHPVAAGLDDRVRLGERDPRERDARHLDLEAVEPPDLLAVALGDGLQARDEQLLLHRHHVLVRVDPGDLGVDRGELGRVPRGERRVGAEHRRDREHLPEARGLGHLLVVLRRLREVGLAELEVVELEQLGPRLRRRGHERRGVQLDEAALDPPAPPGVLERRLHPEEQGVARHAEVEEAPVQPLVDRGVVGDRRLRVGGRGDLDRLHQDLDAAELDPLVVLEHPADREERALREPGDLLRERVGGALLGARVDQLDGAGLVAQHDELHLLLVADGLHPAGDGHRAVGRCGEVGGEDAGGHRASLVAGNLWVQAVRPSTTM